MNENLSNCMNDNNKPFFKNRNIFIKHNEFTVIFVSPLIFIHNDRYHRI